MVPSRQPGEDRELCQPRRTAEGLHAQLVQLAVEGLEERVEAPVIAQLWEVSRRYDRFLMDEK
jgi:hypothetical protein